jgi:cellulose synthase/poly-beta-1,6-N-acetylglucosamine synthase-like glycosyltransferase
MAVVFWVCVAAVAYVYVGYPLLLRVWARWRPRPLDCNMQTANCKFEDPGVSIIIAARNEGARLGARLDNLLSLDYPASKRQIIVVSDGSTDNTLDVLARHQRFVDVVAVPPGGKALALNAGVAQAKFEIVVFADARQVFAPDALRELTAPFRDRTVGAVTGELLLDAESPCRRTGRDRRAFERRMAGRATMSDRRFDERRRTLRSTIADGVGLYWKYEKQMRRLESLIGSTLGATGAIYAVRRALYRPLPADTVLDDVLTPMRVVLAGYRVVFNERARAFDRAAADADAEARRKVRTLAGNYQILALEPQLLLPWRNPVWLQYVSHKLGRLAVPYAVLAIFSASIVLTGLNGVHLFGFYGAALACQVAFYLLAGVGALIELRARRRDDAAVAREATLAVPAPQPAREIA